MCLLPCQLGDIRLVGDTPLKGRIEVYLNGQWGTVCYSNWNYRIVRVACAQLGHGFVASRQIHYGGGTGPIWLSHLDCTGDEDKLVDCPRDAVVSSSCDHSHDAGVHCTDEILPKFTQTGELQQHEVVVDCFMNKHIHTQT